MQQVLRQRLSVEIFNHERDGLVSWSAVVEFRTICHCTGFRVEVEALHAVSSVVKMCRFIFSRPSATDCVSFNILQSINAVDLVGAAFHDDPDWTSREDWPVVYNVIYLSQISVGTCADGIRVGQE